MIAIIDYKAGNLASVARAINYLGFKCFITGNVKKILNAERLIFPGVGSARQAMIDLQKLGLDKAILEYYKSERPFLGICLGTQVILEESGEGKTKCLGIIPGSVRHFPLPLYGKNGNLLKVPHMGWNQVEFKSSHPLLHGVEKGGEFYFVHSYFPAPKNNDVIIGTTDYGITFASVLAYKNLIAVQFHPEKSGKSGLTILKNFCLWKP